MTDESVEVIEAEITPHAPGIDNVRGALWMLASALAFTVSTTLIKYLGDGYPAALQGFYRQLAGFVVLLPWMIRGYPKVFHTTRLGILLFRSGAGAVALIMSFYSYQKMPLADANALSFTRTLWLVPLAFFVLREKLGPLRIGAALVGFAGVLIILHPTGHGITLGLPQLAGLAAAFLFAMTITGMKVMTRDHSPMTLLVYAAGLGLIFATPPALFVWRWPSLPDLGLLAAMGVSGTITQACYIKGMAIGDAGAMAPIDYTRLVFATLAGVLLFKEIPGWPTIIGAAIVVGSTLFITLRERQLARRGAAMAVASTPSDRPALFEVVRLLRALPDDGLDAGATGAVVSIYDKPREAYEVEFIDGAGKTLALLALTPDQFERLEPTP